MGWRERQRVREHREPPVPPRQVFLVLDEQQNRQLDRLARKRKQEPDQVLTRLVSSYLKRQKAQADRERRQAREASQNGRH